MPADANMIWLLAILAGASCAVCAWVLLKLLALDSRMNSLSKYTADLESQLDSTISGSLGMGKRIVNLEKRLRKIVDQQNNQNESVDTLSYGQAMQMLEQGADVETVASNCGFSSSEAQLMQLIQKQLHEKNAQL